MADGEEDDEGGDSEAEFDGGGGSSKKKKMLLIALPIILVLGGGAVAYFTGLAKPLLAMFGKQDEAAAEGDEHGGGEHGAPKKEAAKAPGEGKEGTANAVFYDLPEMLVNINAGRKRNVLKVRVSLELTNEQDIAKVENVLPRIIDSFQVYLRELRLEDLQGAAGMFRLREELLTRVNAAVRPAQVRDVLFKDMLVQ